ncbi:MAG: T9SS type A sorting domain-containing protein, partial [candidate division Zixibacteria bacterium]|nr:T9SS type A sorting domain-containing protein [candidate division Zixibacteria bacterium]
NAPNYHFWHEQVFRLMYPDTEGEPFTLDEEESKFSSFDFNLNEYNFDFDECDFVAFVQDDSTKEIIQGARIELMDLDEYPRFGINVEPNDGDIIIPGEGGSFVYTGVVRNYAAKPETSQVWIKLRFPDGSETQIMNEYDIPLEPLDSFIDSSIVQYIPSQAPEGRYKYKVLVGHYPTVYDSSFFFFDKVPQIQGDQYISSYRIIGWCASCNQRLSAYDTDNRSEFRCSPNPFNPTANISFILQRAQNVKLEIYNILGKRVEKLRDEYLGSGQYIINWDGSKYPSGIYFARLATEEGIRTIKLTLLR